MRNGQNKRMRGRNRGKGQNPLTRVYESNGPDVKIRGTAHHVAEKYLQLARDAQSSGDPVGAENYYQHAEHYFRLIAAAQEQFRQANPYMRPEDQRGEGGGYDESDDDGAEGGIGEPGYGPREPHQVREPQAYQQREHQPREHQPREHQPREHQPREHQPREQRFQREQPYPERSPQPQSEAQDEGDVSSLPAFVTGGAQSAQANGAHAGPANGFEAGSPDRFPLHRRRRRRHGPREGQPEGERPARPAGE